MKTVTFDEAQWQLVPKEPTVEMQAAGLSARIERDQNTANTYKAMLAAAATPPVAQVDDLVEIARLRKAITDYLDGNYDHPRKHRMDTETKGTCAHGVYYWEECGQCIDAHFEAALTATAGQASVRSDNKEGE